MYCFVCMMLPVSNLCLYGVTHILCVSIWMLPISYVCLDGVVRVRCVSAWCYPYLHVCLYCFVCMALSLSNVMVLLVSDVCFHGIIHV